MSLLGLWSLASAKIAEFSRYHSVLKSSQKVPVKITRVVLLIIGKAAIQNGWTNSVAPLTIKVALGGTNVWYIKQWGRKLKDLKASVGVARWKSH